MKKEIYDKVVALGGKVNEPTDSSLKANLEAISFPVALFDRDWGFFGLQDFCKKESSLYSKDKQAFLNKAVEHFQSAGYRDFFGQSFWVHDFFAPMREDSPEYKEWKELLSDNRYTYFSEIKELVGNDPLEFIQIISSYGYPDHYYICLSDPVPENPTVFGTDHEQLFQCTTNYGSLEKFLDQFYDKVDLASEIAKESEKIYSKLNK